MPNHREKERRRIINCVCSVQQSSSLSTFYFSEDTNFSEDATRTSIMTSFNDINNNINNSNNTDPDTEDTASASSNGDNGDSNNSNNNNDPVSVADTLLADGLNALSFQDRNDINEEIHGVSCLAIVETPELISNSIEKLLHEINNNIPNKTKQAYIQSQRYCPTSNYNVGTDSNVNTSMNNNNLLYVNSTEFRLLFLRAELFDIRESALALVNYLNVVLELFGIYALQRPIRLSDFTESELLIFKMGNLQLLPFRDRSGRRIIAGVEGLGIQFDSKLRYKILFYLMWAAVDYNDVETQQRGVVVVIWPVSDVAMNQLKNKEQFIEKQKNYFKGSPVRVCAYHFCVPDRPFFHFLRMIFAYSLENNEVSKLKYHVGHVTELQYLVKGYGLPVDHIPLTESGNVKTHNLKVWLKLRKKLEKCSSGSSVCYSNALNGNISDGGNASDTTSTSVGTLGIGSLSVTSVASASLASSWSMSSSPYIIDCPGSDDVLFRPSKLIKGHPGNVKFHSLIEYEHESGLGIAKASKRIVEAIQQNNGRVLVWDKQGWWIHLTDESQILRKVYVSFRDYKQKKKARIQINDSSTSVFECQDGRKRIRPSSLLSVPPPASDNQNNANANKEYKYYDTRNNEQQSFCSLF